MARKEVVIHDQENLLPTKRLIIVFITLASALFICFIDQNSIGVALPTIGKDLHASSTITWAGTSSLISNTVFQVLYGRLSDILGRKVIIVSCLCLLALGDLLCGFAPSGPLLYFFRALSGIANGGIMALSMMIVSDIVTLKQRGKYQGILGSMVGLGNAVGPLIAASFTTRVSWRCTFWLISPLAALEAVILLLVLPASTIPKESLQTKLKKIDYGGIVFSSSAIMLLLIPISGIGTQFRTNSPMVISMLTLGSVCGVLFIVNEWKLARLPMVPMRLFESAGLTAMLIQSFLIGFSYYTYSYYLPLYFQSARGMDLYMSAVLLLPLVITQATCSSLSGLYISHFQRFREVIGVGFSCWTLGAGLCLLFTRDFPLVGVAFILLLQGIGLGLTFQPTLIAAQAHSRKEDRAVVIGARNFLRAMGGGVGLAVAAAIYSNALKRNLPQTLPSSVREEVLHSTYSRINLSQLGESDRTDVLEAYMAAIRAVFTMWVSVVGVCLVLMVFIKDKPLTWKGDMKKPATATTQPDTAETETENEEETREKSGLESPTSRSETPDVSTESTTQV